jgi:hypothetical protein
MRHDTNRVRSFSRRMPSEPSHEVSKLLRINGVDHALIIHLSLAAARCGLGRSSGLAVA